MAERRGHTQPDLSESEDGLDRSTVGFFELLRQAEGNGLRFGRAGGPSREPARLGQAIRLSFAASDVADVTEAEEPGHVPHFAVNAVGLFGPEGPMPLHLTRWMLTRASNRWFAGDDANATSDTAFLDFCNALQHRMISFYWRAWADMRPEVQIRHGTGGSVSATIGAIAGIGLPDTRNGPSSRVSARLRHATSLGQTVQGPDRLVEYIATVTGTQVRLHEFVGHFTDIPVHLQSRLGQAQLGTDAIAGARIFERAARAEVVLGPLDLETYIAFIDDASRQEELREALVFAMGRNITFDVRLCLKGDEVPPPRIGQVRLGQTTWLNFPAEQNAEDMCMRDVTTSERMAA